MNKLRKSLFLKAVIYDLIIEGKLFYNWLNEKKINGIFTLILKQ